MMARESVANYKEAKEKIRDKIEEIENEKISKIKDAKTYWQMYQLVAKDWETNVEGQIKQAALNMEIEAAEQKIKASKKWHMRTPDAKIKGEVKLG